MKTAEEKVMNFMHRNAVLLAHLSGPDLDMIRHSVKILIKEQDRDTRHACADILIALAKYGDDKDYIKTDEAIAAWVEAGLAP